MRPGKDADGSWEQKAHSLLSTPPAVRKTSVREVIESLLAMGQAGYLPGIATDAQLGFLVMAYQSADCLFLDRAKTTN